MLPAVALPPGQQRAEETQRMLQETKVERGDGKIPRLDLSWLSLEPLNAEFLTPLAVVDSELHRLQSVGNRNVALLGADSQGFGRMTLVASR
jgi:hypothetical protein